MGNDHRRRYAASFSAVADAYERSRPGYPDEAVRWLAGHTPARVLDLGAGTGKLTRALVAAGHDVVAVDPSEEMLDKLAAVAPEAAARVGSAERIPVADASVDVVTVAQAFHWFDHHTALPEIARVLRPGGRLSLVWNFRDEAVPWVAELWTLISPNEPLRIDERELGLREPFGPVDSATFRHSQTLDRAMLIELVTSRSYVAVRSPQDRAPLLDAASAIFDRYATSERLVLDYVARCYRAIAHTP